MYLSTLIPDYLLMSIIKGGEGRAPAYTGHILKVQGSVRQQYRTENILYETLVVVEVESV